MVTILACAVTVIATLAVVGWVQRRNPDTDWLNDVAPYTAPAEPWPLWLLSPRERHERYDPIREDER